MYDYRVTEGSQIRIILDRGDSVNCPYCRMLLSAGMGHLCRKSEDGIVSGQTWRLNGGEQIHAKGAA
jgi:hypothetical protein